MPCALRRTLTGALVALAACRVSADPGVPRAFMEMPVAHLGTVAWSPPRLAAEGDLAVAGTAPSSFEPIEPVEPEVVAIGTCAPLLAEIGRIQEHLVAALDPVLADLDRTLSDRFSRLLDARARAEIVRRCPDARRVLDTCEVLGDTPCPLAPRVVVAGDVAVATPDRATAGTLVGCTDPVALERILTTSARASAQIAEIREVPWAEAALRLAVVADLAAVVEDACVPRRRRYDPEVLDAARAHLAAIDVALAAPAELGEGARFVPDDDRRHVPALGGVDVRRRLEPGPASTAPAARAHVEAFAGILAGAAACGHPDRATTWAVRGPEGAPIPVYPESFVCGRLGPDRRLTSLPVAAASRSAAAE